MPAPAASACCLRRSQRASARASSHCFHRGQGRALARGRRLRRDSLHRAGFRGRGQAPHRRQGRRRRLRFGGQDHIRQEPQLPASARHAGALRRIQRPRSALRSRSSSTARVRSSSRGPRSGITSPRAPSSSGAPATCSAGPQKASSNCAPSTPIRWPKPPRPRSTWKSARPPARFCWCRRQLQISSVSASVADCKRQRNAEQC